MNIKTMNTYKWLCTPGNIHFFLFLFFQAIKIKLKVKRGSK